MPDFWMDVDTALSEVPVNILPLIDDTDFKTREVALTYDASGMDLVWNFITTGGAYTQTAVTPTTSGVYDWAHQGDGLYSIEIPASGGGSINNDTEGIGWFSGFITGVLPWRGPTIGFRAAALNNALINGGDNLDTNVVQIGGDTQSATDLKDFADAGYDPATNKVQGVVLVDTTTTNTDLVSAATISDAVWDEAQADHVGAGTFGIVASEVADILEDTGTTIPGTITTAQNDLDIITGAAGVVIADDSITAAKIADDAIDAASIATGALTADAFAADALVAATFATDSIAADALAADAVTEIRDAITGGAYALNTTASGNIGIDWANVENPSTAVDLSATDIQLADTITTYTGNTPQTADHTAGIADIPTVAEFNARTLVAADYVVVSDTIAAVTTVDSVTNMVTANVTQISGDTTAADNLELMFDGTGYTDSTAPASRSQIEGIINTGSAINAPSDGFTLTDGNEVLNTYAVTAALDGIVHQIDDADGSTGTIDCYYQFSIGSDGSPTSVTFVGRITGSNDSHGVYAYNWGGADWDQVGTFVGVKIATNDLHSYTLYTSHVGTGADLGKVRIRLYGTGLSSPNIYIDQVYISFAVAYRSVGYANGQIWVDTSASNTNTENFVDGVADNPVSTWAAALTLSSQLNIRQFHIASGSSIVLTSNSDDYIIGGDMYNLDLNGQSINNAVITRGLVTGSSTGTAHFVQCIMNTCTIEGSTIHESALINTITLAEAATYFVDACYAGIAGASTPIFDFGAAVGDTKLSMRHWSGGVEIQNMGGSGSDTMSLEGNGQLIINANCSGGIASIRGNFTVTDNAGGAVTLNEDARIDQDQIGLASWTYATRVLTAGTNLNDLSAADVNAEVDTALSDIHLDHLLAVEYDPASKPGAATALLNELIEDDGGVSRYTANALEQAPTGGSAPTAAAIADAVWDEAQADHVGAGTFGVTASEIADVLVDTNDLQTNQVGWVTAIGFATEAKQDIIDANIDQIEAAVITNAAGADIAADIIAIKAETANILTDTGTTIPATITTAQNDLDIITGAAGVVIADNSITVDKIADNAITVAKVADDALTAAKFATGALTADAFAADALVAATFATDSITADALAADALAEINTEVDTALSDIHLDHLLAVEYDPASKPGVATALLNELIEDDGGVSRYTANALEQAPTGGSAPTAAAIADAVWDEAQADHVGVGTFGVVASEVADVLVDTNDLQTNQGSWATATGFATEAKQDIIDANVDQIEAAVITNAAGADIAADIIAIKAETANILTDTGTTIPAAITTAQNDLDIITGASGVVIADDSITAAKIATDAIDADALSADALAEINTQVSDALNTAMPGSPTSDSINDYISRTKKVVCNKQVITEATGDTIIYEDNDSDEYCNVSAAYISAAGTTTRKKLE